MIIQYILFKLNPTFTSVSTEIIHKQWRPVVVDNYQSLKQVMNIYTYAAETNSVKKHLPPTNNLIPTYPVQLAELSKLQLPNKPMQIMFTAVRIF